MEEGENGLELFLSAGHDRLGASSTRSHRPDHLQVLGHVHVIGRHQRIVGHRLEFGKNDRLQKDDGDRDRTFDLFNDSKTLNVSEPSTTDLLTK